MRSHQPAAMQTDAKMQQYLLLAKSARGRAAAELVMKATSEPSLYAYGELLDMASVREVRLQPPDNTAPRAPWLRAAYHASHCFVCLSAGKLRVRRPLGAAAALLLRHHPGLQGAGGQPAQAERGAGAEAQAADRHQPRHNGQGDCLIANTPLAQLPRHVAWRTVNTFHGPPAAVGAPLLLCSTLGPLQFTVRCAALPAPGPCPPPCRRCPMRA